LAPCSANLRAMASPMPLEAPVTKAVLSCKSPMGEILCGYASFFQSFDHGLTYYGRRLYYVKATLAHDLHFSSSCIISTTNNSSCVTHTATRRRCLAGNKANY